MENKYMESSIRKLPVNPDLIPIKSKSGNMYTESSVRKLPINPDLIPIKKTTFKDNVNSILSDFKTATASASADLWGFFDWLIPDDQVAALFGVENKVGEFFDYARQVDKPAIEEDRKIKANADPGVAAFGTYIMQPAVRMAPNAIMAMATGGTSAAASAGATLASGAATASTAARVIDSTATMMKSPMFWNSFMQTTGGSYNEALADGATESEAKAYAFLNGFLGATVEMGGGIETLPGTRQGMRSWVKSALEEGKEEVVQGVISQLAAAAMYEQDKEWYSWTNTDVVFNPARMLQEFAGGTILGGIMGGNQIAVNKAINSIRLYSAATQIGNQYIKAEGGHSIDEALQIGLSNAKGTDAYAAAKTIQERVNKGQSVSPYALGRMVMESQSDAAVRARAIEQTALQSAEQTRYPTDSAENIAAAAVKLNQPVVFGNAAQFQAGQAAYYDHDNQVVVLNPNVKEQALEGYVLAHEMVHSAQATQQMQALENTVRRMMGANQWAAYQAQVREEYASHGISLTDMQVRQEAIANWVGENLFKQGFAQMVAKGNAKTGGLLLRSLDKLRRAVGIKNSRSAGNIAMLERLVMEAIGNRTATRSGEGVQYAITEPFVDSNGNQFPASVLLDTDFFNGLSPRNWGEKLKSYVESRSKNNPLIMPIVDENGSIQQVQFARKNDRVVKDGHVSHPVISKLTSTTDNISKLAVIHIDEVLEVSEEGNPYYSHEHNHQWLDQNGWLHRTAYVINSKNGNVYELTVDIAKARDGRHILYATDGKIKRAGNADVGSLKIRGPRLNTNSNTTIAQNADGVNTHSMQEGGGYTQNAFLPADQFVDRMAETPSGADGATSLPEGGYGNGGAAQVDDAAVLESAVRSQLQGRPTAQASDIDGIIAELGEDVALRRMWSATQIDRPTGTVEIDGRRVSAEAYMNAYEDALPNDPAWLQNHILELEERQKDIILQMEKDGTLNKYKRSSLPINLQLFAAKRKLELYVPEGENGTKDRRFLWQRTRGLDANKAHEDELIEYISGRSETYNPISNEETLNEATENLTHRGYEEDLIKRLTEDNPRDMFNEVEAAAVMVMINNARNDGDLETYGDLVQLLSRKGTIAGRAVQIYALQAKLTPEGTIRHGHKVLREETDHVYGKGTSDAIDMVADDVMKTVEQELQADANRPYLPEFEEDTDFSTQVDGWENRNDEGYITVGNVPGGSPLQQVGIPAGKMYFDVSKLKKMMADHADHLSPDVLKQIPSLLKKPIAIVEYKPGESTNTVNVYGELYHNGKPIMVSVVVTLSPGGSVISKIRTVHARRDYAGKITDDSILYLWDDKEETDAWFQSLNLPVPLGGTTYGLIRSIAHPFGNSDIQKGTATQTQTRGQRVPTSEQDNGSNESVPQAKSGVKREKKTFDTERAQKILDKVIQDKIEDAPQLKKWLTRKDIRLELSRRIAKLVEDGALTNSAMQKTFREVLELPQLTTEDMSELIRLVNEMNAAEIGSAQQAEAEEAIYRLLGSKLPSTRLEKWQSWRKLAMLANPKTHIRNMVSNAVNNQVVGRADTAIHTALQRIFLKPEARTAYLGWSHTDHGRSIRPILDKEADAAVARMRLGQGKYDIGTSKLSRYKRPFGWEWANDANDWNSGAMEWEDSITFRNAYRDALGQYMTARGLTEVTKEADEIAFKRAEEATFRANNVINDVMMAIKKFARSDKKALRLFGHAMDVMIPFTKTPANIAVASFEHSPLGLIKGGFELVQHLRNSDSKSAADIINTFAKGITGTALWAIGLLLGHLGLFNTGFGKTEKERAADELAGLQENAFVFGGVSISFDWLQPAASPLIVGASIGKRLAEDDISLSAVFGAVMDGTDSLFEMTMLQSLYDILGGYEAGATATVASIAENAVSQSIPTLLGQFARAIDPVQRKTTGDSDFETIVNQVLAKIPGLTYLLDPELDVWGNEVYRTGKPSGGNAVWNVVQQFVSPANAKVGTGNGDPISEEILRLYRSHGSTAVPTAVSRDDARDGGMDYVEINRRLGRVNRQAVEDFINNQWPYDVQVSVGGKKKKVTKYYRDMTDEERVRVLSRIYTNTKKEVTEPAPEKPTDTYFQDIYRRLN